MLKDVLNENIKLEWRRTKIIATLGPSSNSREKIKQLIEAGVNVFRLNMSHGDHQQHRQTVKRIRSITRNTDNYIAILMDLCGPKIRAGLFEDGEIELEIGENVTISCRQKTGKPGLIPSQYKNLYKDVKPLDRILLDDGNLEIQVDKIEDQDVICQVIHGGILKDNKGINLPDSQVSITSFTAKDKKDAELAVELGADFLALSFVRNVKDINQLKNFLKKLGQEIPVIAKIEKPESVNNIDDILQAAYGIMLARGDLGIELPAQKVPLIQKEIIIRAREANRPVIVATQMMESMITSARPTRAEVGDVANAALSSADAVMLSAETASGQHPIEVVMNMDGILREIEGYQWGYGQFGDKEAELIGENPSDREAIARAVNRLAGDLKLQGIVVPTTTGTTAKVLAAKRPIAPLLGVCSDLDICRRLALHWGVIPFQIDEKKTHDWKQLCHDISERCKLTRTGNMVLLVSGFREDPEKNEPVIKLMRV